MFEIPEPVRRAETILYVMLSILRTVAENANTPTLNAKRVVVPNQTHSDKSALKFRMTLKTFELRNAPPFDLRARRSRPETNLIAELQPVRWWWCLRVKARFHTRHQHQIWAHAHVQMSAGVAVDPVR